MTADDPPLWLPGWEVEPCDTAPPPAQVRRRTYIPLCLRDIETVCRWNDEASDCPCMQPDSVRPVETVPTGEYL